MQRQDVEVAVPQGWRIVGVQAAPTTSDSLKTVWH